mmetsp:Transcript_3575/g.11112  ORF Transcript_3575/g.11112 Transcript_3575/m.11112 type:complete len:257 (+) Transcript_3575:467-1237(+)
MITVAGDHVHHAGRYVGALEHTEQLYGGQWVLLRRHDHHRVATHDGRCEQRHKGQQRTLVRAGDAHHAHRLVDRDGRTVQGSLLHVAAVLVREGRPVEETINAGSHLVTSSLFTAAGHRVDQLHILIVLRIQVLGHKVQDLRAVVGSTFSPTRCRSVGSFDGVTDIFAVAFANLPEQLTGGTQNRTNVGSIRTALTSADVHLVSSVHSLTNTLGKFGRLTGDERCGGDGGRPRGRLLLLGEAVSHVLLPLGLAVLE